MEIELGKISCVYGTKEFCDCLISVVNIVMMVYHDGKKNWLVSGTLVYKLQRTLFV
jgi:hypothetical protein